MSRLPDRWLGAGVGAVALGAVTYLGGVAVDGFGTASAPAPATTVAATTVAPVAPAASRSDRGTSPGAAGAALAPANPNDLAGDPPQSDLVAPARPGRAGAGAAARRLAAMGNDALPEGEFGEVVRAGRDIFTDTPRAAAGFVGNDLRCSSCHLDGGRLADSAPLWAAYVSYPAYRSKTGSVTTFQQRLQDCFEYSMNGRAPALGSKELVALESYACWLAQGVPVDPRLPGRGYPALARPAQAADFARGGQVYEQQCALCHGPDGAGQHSPDGTMVFPALSGPGSFNWGAGMGRLSNAAAFIRANMPLGLRGSLTVQQAWDVAMFMNSHDRPQDPRWTGTVEGTRSAFHDTVDSMYGREVAGHLLGDSGPARPLARR